MEHNRVYKLINFFERLNHSQVQLRFKYSIINPLLEMEETPSIPRSLDVDLHDNRPENLPEEEQQSNAYEDVPQNVDYLYESYEENPPIDGEGDAANEVLKEGEAVKSKNSEERINDPPIDGEGDAPKELQKEEEAVKLKSSEENQNEPPIDGEGDAPKELLKEEKAIEPKNLEEKQNDPRIDGEGDAPKELLKEEEAVKLKNSEENQNEPPIDGEGDAPKELLKEEQVEPKNSQEYIGNDLEIETSREAEPSEPQLVFIPDGDTKCFYSNVFREQLEEVLRKQLRSRLEKDAQDKKVGQLDKEE